MMGRGGRAGLALALLLALLPAGRALADLVVGELVHERAVTPGTTYEGVIPVRNNGSEAEEVKLYQTDYLSFADGRNQFDKPGTLARSNAKWVSFSPNYLVIPPQGSADVSYTVKVPGDKPVQGTYWSLIMVEGMKKDMPAPTGKRQLRIKQVIRYGVQLITDIGNTGSRKLKFLDKRIVRTGNKPVLQLDLQNAGERWLNPAVSAELYNDKGALVGKYGGAKVKLYPGASARQTIELGGVPRGKYKALIVVDNGDEYVFGAQYRFAL